MTLTVSMFLVLCPLIFLAAFIDAIAGGGGVISIPAYLFIGLPAHYAAGSNKFSAFMGAITATAKYIRTGNIKLSAAIWSALGAVFGSMLGARVALLIPAGTLKTVMLVAIPVVAVILFTQKDRMMIVRDVTRPRWAVIVISIAIGLFIGAYDGLLGPGTGTFMILCFSALLGYDLLTASGCAKLSNMASNVGSLLVYILSGKVIYALAIPAALCSVLGGYCGARYAIKHGSKNVRVFIFVVLGLLFLKFGYDLIFTR